MRGARPGDAGIPQQFAIGARQDSDVAPRTLDDRDIAAQLVELNRRFRCVVAIYTDDVEPEHGSLPNLVHSEKSSTIHDVS